MQFFLQLECPPGSTVGLLGKKSVILVYVIVFYLHKDFQDVNKYC